MGSPRPPARVPPGEPAPPRSLLAPPVDAHGHSSFIPRSGPRTPEHRQGRKLLMPHGPEHHQDPPLEEPIPPNRRGGGGKGQFLKQNVELPAENGGRRVAYLVRPSMPATASPRLPGSERPPPPMSGGALSLPLRVQSSDGEKSLLPVQTPHLVLGSPPLLSRAPCDLPHVLITVSLASHSRRSSPPLFL